MEKQNAGKRPIALPITLVLLVFSLIGNVFLYSQYLQNKQQNNYEFGQTVVEKLTESRLYAQEMMKVIDWLAQSTTQADRYELAYQIGRSAALGYSVSELMTEAGRLSESDAASGAEEAEAYVNAAAAKLTGIAHQEGKLSDNDQEQLIALKADFEEMEQALGGFNYSIGENRTASIRLASGLEWLDIAKKMEQVIKQQ
ncbi:hypothetical protein [Paenibacillus sp. YIM B09110]|uniref:hypothetical protein n=1 Tax=Paenibacillus sp. YIM B09110 TaxID=3126102 RepID=UPI00301CA875